MAGVKVSLNVRVDGLDKFEDKVVSSESKINHGMAQVVAAGTSSYVPADTLSLDERTRTVDKYVIYPGPYARMQYGGKVMVDAQTGKGPPYRLGAILKASDRDLEYNKKRHRKATDHWFEAAKRDKIEKWARAMKGLILRYGRK